MNTRKLGLLGALLFSNWVLTGCGTKIALELLGSGMDSALEACRATPQGQQLPRDECRTARLGAGLECPETVESNEDPVECEYQHEFTIVGMYPGYGDLGRAGRKARVLVVTRTTENRRASHTHHCEADTEGACAESFVSSKVRIHQKGEIQIAWSLLGFLQWETVVRQDRTLDFCTWEDHPLPLECAPVENPS